MMGTRCGDIDPAVVTFLIDELNMSGKEVNELMNKKSDSLEFQEKAVIQEILRI